MRHLKNAFTVIGVVTILVLAANTVTIAATGQGFLLGKSNSANTITGLTRTTSGSALKLQTASSTNPPLTVNGKGKVINLNADMIDGFTSTDLRDRTWVFTSIFTDRPSVNYLLPLPNGSYLITYSASFPGITSAAVRCFVSEQPTTGDPGTTTAHEAQTNVTAEGSAVALNGAGHATKSAEQNILVSCSAVGATWSTNANNPLMITATPTSIVSTTAIDPLVAD